MRAIWAMLMLCASTWYCAECNELSGTTLNVGVLLELSKSWYRNYAHLFVYVFEHVFETIQNRTDILPGYNFQMTVKDTQGNNGLAAAQLIKLLEEGEPKVAVIGPTKSGSLTVTGQISPVYNVTQLSCIAVTAATSDASLFPTLIKVNQASDLLNPLRIKIMQHFRWSRAGTIAYQDDISVSQMSTFLQLLQENNMTLASSATFSATSNIPDIISAFKQFDIRIIMVAVHGEYAAHLFCEAYKQGVYGSSYVWILSGATLHNNMFLDQEPDGCSLTQVQTAADGFMSIHTLVTSLSDKPTISGLTAADQIQVFKDMLAGPLANTTYRVSAYLPWVIDTAWSLAIGLNNSVRYLEERGLNLANYTYSTDYLHAIQRGIRDVSFNGVSGPVSFASTGSRVGLTYIKQYSRNGSGIVAYYDLEREVLTWTVPETSIWKDGRVPQDRFIYREYVVTSSVTVVTIVVCLNSLGCLLSITFITFNICYRNSRSIKMSSPMLNNVIIGGCMLVYIDVFITAANNINPGVATASDAICMIRTWLVTLAFTLLFGALFSKTYRVYVMFRDYRVRQKFIKDYHLFGMIGVMLMIDCAILVPWTLFAPLSNHRLTTTVKDSSDNNVIFSRVYLFCHHELETYWTLTIYVYKGLLLAFGMFLAWETRNVTVQELNDSKYIGACIYNVVVMCIFGVPLAHVLPIEEKDLKFVLESCLIFFCTTICQCILFLPKLHNRNKVHGRMLQDTSMLTVEGTSIVTGTTHIPLAKPELSSAHSDVIKDTNESRDQQSSNEKSIYLDVIRRLEDDNTSLRQKITTEVTAVSKLKESLLEITGNVQFYKSGDSYVVFKKLTTSESNENNAGDDVIDVFECGT